MADQEKAELGFEETSSNEAKAAANGDNRDIDIDLETYGEEHGYPLEVEVLKQITPKCKIVETQSLSHWTLRSLTNAFRGQLSTCERWKHGADPSAIIGSKRCSQLVRINSALFFYCAPRAIKTSANRYNAMVGARGKSMRSYSSLPLPPSYRIMEVQLEL